MLDETKICGVFLSDASEFRIAFMVCTNTCGLANCRAGQIGSHWLNAERMLIDRVLNDDYV